MLPRTVCQKRSRRAAFSGIMTTGDEHDEPRERTASSYRAAVHGHAGTERPPAAQDRRGGGFQLHP